MNDLERIIWAGAFAVATVRFLSSSRYENKPEDLDAFHAVEIADIALEKYREAIAAPPGDSGVAFYPASEGWPWATK